MLYIVLFIFLIYLILTHSSESLYYAFHGLTLWYQKMVPALLPFMILSGTLIRMHLTGKFVVLIHPLLKRIFRCNENVSYGIIIGFLCGFPMGAKTASDLLKEERITITEARFLLSFCNNIGPVYFCSFVLPLLQIDNIAIAVLGMYGLPFLYGIILRYTFFRNKISFSDHAELQNKSRNRSLLDALDESVKSGIGSISVLCGYMIIFNMLNIVPHLYFPQLLVYISPILEITGGLTIFKQPDSLYTLIILPFGGLSCIAQTNSIIYETKLSLKEYILHKSILTFISVIYYLSVITYI